jgi:hypothetical protein
MDALTTVRAVLVGSALACALAVGGAAPASAASTGMAAEFPVGTCIDYQNDHLAFQNDNLIYVTAVSCTDPGRDYRVTAQVANAPLCDSVTNFVYTTRDLVVLCVVQDRAAPA